MYLFDSGLHALAFLLHMMLGTLFSEEIQSSEWEIKFSFYCYWYENLLLFLVDAVRICYGPLFKSDKFDKIRSEFKQLLEKNPSNDLLGSMHLLVCIHFSISFVYYLNWNYNFSKCYIHLELMIIILLLFHFKLLKTLSSSYQLLSSRLKTNQKKKVCQHQTCRKKLFEWNFLINHLTECAIKAFTTQFITQFILYNVIHIQYPLKHLYLFFIDFLL